MIYLTSFIVGFIAGNIAYSMGYRAQSPFYKGTKQNVNTK